MRKITLSILIIALFLLAFAGITCAMDETEKIIIGKIVELDETKNLVQVENRHYKPDLVLVDTGLYDEPILGSIHDLEEGDLVQVYVKGKESPDFWTASKIVLFSGPKEEEILKSLE